jgi:hypothetical protein
VLEILRQVRSHDVLQYQAFKVHDRTSPVLAQIGRRTSKGRTVAVRSLRKRTRMSVQTPLEEVAAVNFVIEDLVVVGSRESIAAFDALGARSIASVL